MKVDLVKRIFFVLILAALSLLSACTLESSSNYSPTIRLINLPRSSTGDTLKLRYSSAYNDLLLDTIRVGDTVTFQLELHAYSNNLTRFELIQSSDSISRLLLPRNSALDSIFMPSSNYKTGKFIFREKIKLVYFTFNYLARKPSNEGKFTIAITSDAVFDENFNGSNQAVVHIKTPILPAR